MEPMDGPELDTTPKAADAVAANPVKPGAETTEYAETRKAAAIASLISILGVITTLGGSVAQALGTESKAGILCGSVVAVAGVIARTLVALGYVKSRTYVKVGA